MRHDLPSGKVTFLFTDVEGSTKLLHELGAADYAKALAEHRHVVREVVGAHRGVVVDAPGDAFFIAFPTAAEAVTAAREAQQGLATGPVRVRMGLDTGEPVLAEEGYVGVEVHRAARIAAAGHGGQVLVSKSTREAIGMPFPMRDLGEHRVKDFSEPVWIFQLGPDRFPPLKTISNTNLPRPASSFVGRNREVKDVASMLLDGARLLTLTGPGGTGKTRLAIEAAVDLVPEFKNGVFWVNLAQIRDPALVAETVSQTIGAKERLVDHIGDRVTLLLLDNFEQVVPAAPAVADLVEACPNLRVLVTSRELLRVRSEVEYAVPPLTDPEAVELFCSRSRLQPDVTIEELCRRLDALPLAIELAAARTTVLTPAQILERLADRLDLFQGRRDADARQKTLRATIEWSYDLLTEDERSLFARLSVFPGGCTLQAAQVVCRAELDTLQSVVEKSLLRHRADRFWMLETILDYAATRLEQSGEAEEMRHRHTQYFLALAEEASQADLRWSPGDWLDRLERDHDNFRAAQDRVEVSGESELALRFGAALWRFWQMRGHREEGYLRLESALRADERPSAARAKALNGVAVMAAESGNAAAATDRAEEALALNRALGDLWGIAFSEFMLAQVASEAGDFQRALPHWEESVATFRELGDENYALLTSCFIAMTYIDLGDRGRARGLHQDVLRQARAIGNLEMEEDALQRLAEYALQDGRVQEAVPMLKEALRICRNLGGDFLEAAVCLRSFAWALALASEPTKAALLLSCSETAREEMGIKTRLFREPSKEELDRIRTQLDEAGFAVAWERGRKLTVDEGITIALESEAATGAQTVI